MLLEEGTSELSCIMRYLYGVTQSLITRIKLHEFFIAGTDKIHIIVVFGRRKLVEMWRKAKTDRKISVSPKMSGYVCFGHSEDYRVFRPFQFQYSGILLQS